MRKGLVLAVVVLISGCLMTKDGPTLDGFDGSASQVPIEEEATDESAFEVELEPAGGYTVTTLISVGQLIDRWACSTAPTMPLNAQIADQMNCIEGGFFERIDDISNVSLGSAANPFLQGEAARALRRAAASSPGSTFVINSSWRSVVQQYVLDSWEGSCGISIAATPGRSNHESGLAIDVPLSTTTSFRSALRDNGFRWYCDANSGGTSSGCRDTPHHDYRAGGTDLRTRAVLAFQQLWNHAHPEDQIGEDGQFGPQTAARIRRAPLAGFASGSTCSVAGAPADRCGDGTCGGHEDCSSCAMDCGDCGPECGDGRCDATETCSTCSWDCGDCPASTCTEVGGATTGENSDPCSWSLDDQWRCVFSPEWGVELSQVCRDGRWQTFNLEPRNCEGCCGDYSSACRAD